MSRVYYNEFDPFAAQWLRNLISAGHIAPGDVDERSIVEVKADDLAGYTQCHFFAGIGGWSLALRLAGVPDDFRCWTGSCPCQPFSDAGERRAESDERHLWPEFYRLATEARDADRKIPVLLGEQVASRLGRDWLAGVRADLEALGYEVGAADLCAASVGAPHIRQRLYWVAVANGGRCEGPEVPVRPLRQDQAAAVDGGPCCGLGYATCIGDRATANGGGDRACEAAGRMRVARGSGAPGWLGNAVREGREGQPLGLVGTGGQGYWDAFDLIPCRDGKSRRVEPGTFPLAHGVSNRVGLLRGYGNAIVPQVAAAFIRAALG